MGSTWESLLEDFVRVRDAKYRNMPEYEDARMASISYTIQTILEKLRDADAFTIKLDPNSQPRSTTENMGE